MGDVTSCRGRCSGFQSGRSIFLLLLLLPWTVIAGEPIDRIMAVVEDGVILESELRQKLESIKASLLQSDTPLPPDDILARQVLERMIVDKIQVHMAEKAGIRVDDETLRQAVQQIAQRNNMSLDEFRRSLRQEGIDYAAFIEQIRNEITVGRLRSSQINNQIKVSDHEVQHYLETQGKLDINRDSEYLLGHILIATPQAASPSEVQKAKEKAERLVEELRQGLDFKQAALSSSDAAQALNGGDLGWRKLSQIPSLFVDLVPTMKEGSIEGPIRSPSGFHIIKLLGIKGGADESMTKTHVRHILIKPNEVLSDEDAKQKLLNLKQRIEAGEDFATLARGHSDDKGSAIKGGDLGFVQPGALVPPFEEAMNRLEINELSEPVQTQFGWHLIQVLERQESSDTDELLKNKAREEIFKRKVEEETELWLRRIRDEAYVEIRLNEPETTSFMPSFQ
ncbi:peptidylprolyl isomerase [Methylocaldum szegediense]|uniref:Chaperone SurA n=1 Tax=Methylocaldum szegediense TaxID=73780 RepID=A0ABM9I558_9GAMM|nr:peptidylprolyl isomerase [Methylocaldum szegediense]CAI8899335.1 Chaperone SurA [Methylocaldum szegediense]